MLRSALPLLATAALCIGTGWSLDRASLAADAPALTIAAEARPEAVFLHRRDACAQTDVPDVPARAFRTDDGRVRLLASHHRNRLLSGPDLDRVRPDCAIVYEGRHSDAPEDYDDRSWLSAVTTLDGRTVVGLVSNEFHGQLRPRLCPAARYASCWYNVVTAVVSGDAGEHFQRLPGRSLVAAAPYRYTGTLGRRSGIFSPSNIIRHQGYWYVFVWAEAWGVQQRGACLLRTDRIEDPQAWRAWDGRSFSMRFADPYRDPAAPDLATGCVPVAQDALSTTVRSIVRDRASGRFIAVLAMTRPAAPGAASIAGIWTSTSPELLAWSEPQLLWKAALLTHVGCADDAAYYYPALLDPADSSRNFEEIGDSPHLYLTRLNLQDCGVTWDRDLVRLPVHVSQ